MESEPVTDQPKAAATEAAADDGAGEEGKTEILHKIFPNTEMASFFRRS